ncbi:Oidioi.mRNA.OKI2018_I69.PAR.g11828.t1.cds [Oikopleura dioica]|uniref:Oidioi.mRNA.OKI2018_I69.PAR.g11828.t1.cds n=1 Tax=Oikopleura dioica TaxID=34765 RepID=A0ABN7RXJ7_OIKDI|nr:Oidioi.mRNA.OKI2018_I69.PAR.g11828.t1.cds [Oikopleura dioica]
MKRYLFWIKAWQILMLAAKSVDAWVYLTMPPGSNNRLNESTAENKNPERLFKSNNHRRGGYNKPDATKNANEKEYIPQFLSGSYLPIEWGQVNGCKDCEVIIQGMCGDHLKNGETTENFLFKAPANRAEESNLLKEQLQNDRYGQHEDISHFLRCSMAEKTSGSQYGFECEGERKEFQFGFYSGWFDIFHLTNSGKCEESPQTKPLCVENHDGKFFYRMKNESCDGEIYDFYSPVEVLPDSNDCEGPHQVHGYYLTSELIASQEKPQKKCLQLHPPKRCSRNFKTTPGILGNSLSGQLPSVTWQLPSVQKKTVSCVVRLRYKIHIFEDFGPDSSREEIFQDRSHVFQIIPRPSEILPSERVYNLNVRGKRGNIVQVYPAVEYDFTPNDLKVMKDDLIHIQWWGSNSHNNKPPGANGQTGDDGQGKSGTDRSTFTPILSESHNFPIPFENSTFWKDVDWIWSSTEHKPDQGTIEDLAIYFATSGYYDCRENCKKSPKTNDDFDPQMNNSPASISGHIIRMKEANNYHYMSSRNNNFSNRSQKGKITVL